MNLRKLLFLFALCLAPCVSFAQGGPFVISSASSTCASIGVGGPIATVVIDVEGTFSLTLQPELSINGRAPGNTGVTPITSGASSQSTITSAGYYRADVAGSGVFELCPTSYASGSATVYLSVGNAASTSASSGGISGSVGINAGTNNIGKVNILGNGGAAVDAAAGASAATNSVAAGGTYNSSAPSPSSGQQEPLQLDASANLKVNLQTALPAGTNSIGTVTSPTGANFQVDVANNNIAAAGSIPNTNSATCVGTGVASNGVQFASGILGSGAVMVTITGTFGSSNTISFYEQIDGTNYILAPTSGGSVSGFTAVGQFVVNTSGLTNFGVCGPPNTGTVTVNMQASLASLPLAPGLVYALGTMQPVNVAQFGGTAPTTKAASTQSVAGDTSVIVQINPNQPNLTTPLNVNTSQWGSTAVTSSTGPGSTAGIYVAAMPPNSSGAAQALTVGAVSTPISGSVGINLKGSAGNLIHFHVLNLNASVCYLELLNSATTGTLGTELTDYGIPSSGVLDVEFAPYTVNFTTGIAFGGVTAKGGSTACGAALVVSAAYR